jgi:uncharacterized delta-60 repeat protein
MHLTVRKETIMPHPSPLTPGFGRRLASLFTAMLVLALLAALIGARPAAAATFAARQLSAAAAPLSPPAGLLDPAFDSDGMVTTGVGSTDLTATGQAVAIQSDGKIVVAGVVYNGNNQDFALTRYNSDGSLDSGFDGDGRVVTDFAGGGDAGRAVAIQSDGKIVVAGHAWTGSHDDFALARYNSDGSLDTGFGVAGKVTLSISGSYDVGRAVAIQSTGAIVVAGFVDDGYYDFVLVRFTSAGVLDTGFDGDGVVTTDFGSYETVQAVAIQSGDKIVVAGSADNGNDLDFALARYNADGSLDTGFDIDGMVTTDFGSSEYGQAVAIQSGDKIVVAGSADNGNDFDFALARYNDDGSLDTGFDGDGMVTTDFGSSETGQAVAIQSGKIVVAGYGFNGNDDDFALARYDSFGALDGAFDSDGRVTIDFGSSSDAARGVAIQSGGETVVAGSTSNGSHDDFALARVASNGSLDTTFNGDGRVTTDFLSSGGTANAVAIQSDGKIVVAGFADNGGQNDFALTRFDSNGSLDTAFDSDGKLTTDFGGGHDQANAVAIQSDGKIVVAGSADSYNGFALARYNNDGSLDISFDGDGRVITAIPGGSGEANAVAIQSDGKIVVAGYADDGSNVYFALARYNGAGSPDTSFDGDGLVMTTIASGFDQAHAVAIQDNGKIVVAGKAHNGSNDDFALARYNSDGSLDTSFDSDGKVTTGFVSGSEDRAYAMAIQKDGKIVAAGHTASPGVHFALARYNSNGSLDTGFDGDGKVTTALGVFAIINAVAIQSDGKIVVAGDAAPSVHLDFALARYNYNGSLDTGFDGDGKVTTHFGIGTDHAEAMAIQSDGKIVAAGAADTGYDTDFALARYQVASTSSQAIANGGSATLEDVTITNNSGGSCTLTVTKIPVPPGGRPADNGEMPIHWQINTDCLTYNFDLVFHYTDTELLFGASVTEANLSAYRSPTGNDNDYALVGGAVNPGANTVTVAGVTQLSWWALADSNPLVVTLAEFNAVQQGDHVLVSWETASELENRGFNLYRGVDPAGPDRQLNSALIPSQSPGSPAGFLYTWEDRADLTPGATYYYWLEDVDLYGAATRHGPVSVTFSAPTAVQLTDLGASSASGPLFGWWAGLAALLAAAAALAGSRRASQRAPEA